jgi:DNA-binding CsgD family transcriptional regulator
MGYIIDALTSSPSTRIINAKGDGLLSPREEQVVNLVAEGIGNREVAQQLGIKENTVKKALLRIYDKLDVSNRVELVLYALTHRGAEASAPSGRRIRCWQRIVSSQCRSAWVVSDCRFILIVD